MIDLSDRFDWKQVVNIHGLYLLLFSILRCKAQNYPIQTGKLLDGIGRLSVRKWRLYTLAASATFQCLVVCHGLVRPARDIDVLAFLNIVVPDQRVVWKTWKERVADRIVYKKAEDINLRQSYQRSLVNVSCSSRTSSQAVTKRQLGL